MATQTNAGKPRTTQIGQKVNSPEAMLLSCSHGVTMNWTQCATPITTALVAKANIPRVMAGHVRVHTSVAQSTAAARASPAVAKVNSVS